MSQASSSKPDSKQVPTDQLPQNIDRIRDIIFGPQIREYEHRFEGIKRDMVRLQQDLDRLTQQQTAQKKEQDDKTEELRYTMRQSDDDLRQEMRHTAQALTEQKVDRTTLGELFIELGNQLKIGGSLGDILKGLEGIIGQE